MTREDTVQEDTLGYLTKIFEEFVEQKIENSYISGHEKCQLMRKCDI